MTAKQEPKYIATKPNNYSEDGPLTYGPSTLEELQKEIKAQGCDYEEFEFFEVGKPVKIRETTVTTWVLVK